MNLFVKKGQSKLQAILSGFDTLTQELSSFLEANAEAREILQVQLSKATDEGDRASRVLKKLEELVEWFYT